MTEENTILSFEEALKAINTASDTFKVNIWIPSLNKEVSFKEMDAKQQKTLLKAAIDNTVYNSYFIKAFYDILKENVLDEGISIDDFTIVDKAFVALSLRNQISEDLSVEFTKTQSEKINLNQLVSNFRNFVTPDVEKVDIKNDSFSISVSLGLPTIKDELDYEENFYKNYKKVEDVKTTEDIQYIVSEAFIGETSKYIKVLSINETDYQYSLLTLNQKLRIVEKLPSGLIQKILEKISNWKTIIDSYITVSDSTNTLSKVITVDSLLFLS